VKKIEEANKRIANIFNDIRSTFLSSNYEDIGKLKKEDLDKYGYFIEFIYKLIYEDIDLKRKLEKYKNVFLKNTGNDFDELRKDSIEGENEEEKQKQKENNNNNTSQKNEFFGAKNDEIENNQDIEKGNHINQNYNENDEEEEEERGEKKRCERWEGKKKIYRNINPSFSCSISFSLSLSLSLLPQPHLKAMFTCAAIDEGGKKHFGKT